MRMQQAVVVDTAEQVADLLDVVATASGRITVEADRIAASRAEVSAAMVERLNLLADALRPGADARYLLRRVDTELLLAGASLWLARRRDGRPRVRAAERAAQRWGGEW
jgi:hypothetical protein